VKADGKPIAGPASVTTAYPRISMLTPISLLRHDTL
jgi:hypothetical protein